MRVQKICVLVNNTLSSNTVKDKYDIITEI